MPSRPRSTAARNPHRRVVFLRLDEESVRLLDSWADKLGGAPAGWSRTTLIRAAIARALRTQGEKGIAP